MRYTVLLFAVLSCFAQSAPEDDANLLHQAQRDLFAARYRPAAEAYARVIAANPAESAAYYGLVRALLKDHRSKEANAAADEALQRSPQTAATQSAAGLAAFRRGEIPKAEEYYRSALRLDPKFPGGLHGLGSILNAVSHRKTAREFMLAAYRASPEDPELIVARANTLKGLEHIAALEEALRILDSGTEEAQNLRAHIANDRAVGTRKLRRLVSPYQDYRIKLFEVLDGRSHPRGVSVHVRLNQRQTARLLLDTGASGISLSPKLAEHAGLERLSDEAGRTKGIGDEGAQSSLGYVASEIEMGDLVLADYPVSVFKNAQSPDFDGLIGADVFERFVVTLDFQRFSLMLQRRPENASPEEEDPVDAAEALPAGFYRVFRFGNHLALPASINGGRPTLFLVDSGASVNLLDTDMTREWSKLYRDDLARVKGIQGEVTKVSRTDRITLTFAGFRQENASLTAISLEKMSDSFGAGFAGILGMPVLGQLRLTIDYRDGIVRFERAR